MQETQTEKAISFLAMVVENRVKEAYDRYIGNDLIHHNPNFEGDLTSLKIAMLENAKEAPNKQIEIKLTLEEGELVMIFSHIKQSPSDKGMAAIHIFRFEKEKIVELWGVDQEIPNESPNQYGMF